MSQRGFTLIEIMVVLVILGVTVVFVTLGFNRLESDRLEKQAGKLSTWLQSISDNAVLDSAIYGAWVNTKSGAIELSFYFDNRWWPVNELDDPPPELEEELALLALGDNGRYSPVSTDREKDIPEILFFPTGFTEPDNFELREEGRVARIERSDDGIFQWFIP